MNARALLSILALAAPAFAADGGAVTPVPASAPAAANAPPAASSAPASEAAEGPSDDAAPIPAPAPVPVFAPTSAARVTTAAQATRSSVAESAAAAKVEDLAPERFSFDLASRALFVRDAALGVFSSERKVGLGGLAVRATVYRDGPWAIAVGAAIEGRDAIGGKARGADVSAELHRPTLRAELAYELSPIFDAVGAIGVGGEKLVFRYADAATSEAASADSWKASADVGLGVDAHTRLGPVLVGVRLEGGYLVSGAHGLRVTLPEVGDVARQPIDLGSLATSGAFTRFALRIGY
jgi:hypothetical protein